MRQTFFKTNILIFLISEDFYCQKLSRNLRFSVRKTMVFVAKIGYMALSRHISDYKDEYHGFSDAKSQIPAQFLTVKSL